MNIKNIIDAIKEQVTIYISYKIRYKLVRFRSLYKKFIRIDLHVKLLFFHLLKTF